MTNKDLIPPIALIIFSKDRACQLDLLIRTIRKQLHLPLGNINIIYYATSHKYERGYERLKGKKILPATWRRQKKFKTDLIHCLRECEKQTPLVMLLVDDIVFFKSVHEIAPIRALLDDERIISVSTRQAREYTPYRLPEFEASRDYLLWSWQNADPGTWGYPMSVDGNIFRSHDLVSFIEEVYFKAPNSLEAKLANNAARAAGRWKPQRFASRVVSLFRSVDPLYKKRTCSVAYLEAKIFNNPLNRVQTEGSTWHGDIDAEKLNEAYLTGRIINDCPFYETAPQAPHHLVEEIEFKCE